MVSHVWRHTVHETYTPTVLGREDNITLLPSLTNKVFGVWWDDISKSQF